MSNTPILGAPELALSQAIPETTVNEAVRYLEQGAAWFRFIDRDDAAPPGSPADGDCYLIAASATGAWAGHDGEIAFYMSTAWEFITPAAGMGAYVIDEAIPIVFDGAVWDGIATGAIPSEASASEIWAGTATGKYVSPDKMWDAAVAVALTDGATVTPDLATGINFTWTIAGNRTLANPSNVKPGQTGCIEVTQGSGGTHLISAYGNNYRFAGGTDIVLSTAAGAIDLLFYYVTSDSKMFLSAQKAIAA